MRLGTHTITNESVAIKILEKEKIKDRSDIERVTREINILKKTRHPHVVQLYEVKYHYFLSSFFLYPLCADYRNKSLALPNHGIRRRGRAF